MIDWRARLDELLVFLRSAWGIDDPACVAILAAALCRCPGVRPLWLCLEVNWHAYPCTDGWFSLGSVWQPYSLARLRMMRPREARQQIRQWLDEPDEPRLFIEPDYERLPRCARTPEIRSLLTRRLRVRSLLPRSLGALVTDWREQQRRSDALQILARQLVEDRIGARGDAPPVFQQPANFAYYAELLQRLSPWYPDWTELVNSLASLAVHHARLFGRAETNEEYWKAMSRVAADSVPPWIHRTIRFLNANPAEAEELPARPQLVQ